MTFKQFVQEVRVLPNKHNMTDDSTPLRDDEVVRVYHGFDDFNEALRATRTGISGQERYSRKYNYEGNNNPKGLFVTGDLNVAKEFSSVYGIAAIIEFQCKVSDLEAPVWPGGSYTVQGGMAQYFDGESDREAQRLKDREDVKNASHMPDHVKNSDRPELASRLMYSREFQALFVGHLDPNTIRAVWVREPFEGYQRTDKPFYRLTRQDFLKKYKTVEAKFGQYANDYSDRMFRPNDVWNVDHFVSKMAQRFYKNTDEKATEQIIDGARYLDDNQILRYVWPKQYDGAVAWLHKIK